MKGVRPMPILWTAPEASQATGGKTAGAWAATGVSIDSRTVAPGDLFVAIKGPSYDGHAFVADALGAGAAAVVVSKSGFGASVNTNKLLYVDDTMTALEDLARAARTRSSARIAAVTGSVGKTSTKEALKLALAADAGAPAVAATQGNLNNHWGLPLSLARLPETATYGVFEMGMNHPGEIAPLSRMCRPHAAIITTVADTHSEFFDSLEQIADAKAEILEGLLPDGTAILNRDNEMFARLSMVAQEDGHRVTSFGSADDADWRLADLRLLSDSSTITATFRGQTYRYTLGVPGRHMALNSLAVLAAAEALGADVAHAATGLADMRGLVGRGKRHQVTMTGGMLEVIDESYNASPASMRAAIDVLGRAEPIGGGRRIAVLGDMLELGQQAEKLHRSLARPLIDAGIDVVFTAGQYMFALWDALPQPMRGGHACTAEKLVPLVVAALRPGDIVTVKGSLGSRTRQIVEALLALGQSNGSASGRVVNGS
jgi:UDP-N-acetylmuramoyl-tripeptide--D-alanyl-D-alanine ligase